MGGGALRWDGPGESSLLWTRTRVVLRGPVTLRAPAPGQRATGAVRAGACVHVSPGGVGRDRSHLRLAGVRYGTGVEKRELLGREGILVLTEHALETVTG